MPTIGRIAVAQIDPVVGDFEANVRKIKDCFRKAAADRARLLMTPELSVCGYPPMDLLERPEIFERNEKALDDLRAQTRGYKCALAVGYVGKNPSAQGRACENRMAILEDGKTVFTQAKTLLPTYDVFDEARYFEPAQQNQIWNCDGVKVGVAICEDFWAGDPSFGRRIYRRDPIDCFKDEKVELLLSLSASPYYWGKRAGREAVHADISKRLRAPLVYLNQVGGNDELLFDGGSFVTDAQGKLVGRLPFFRSSYGIIEFDGKMNPSWDSSVTADKDREDQAPEEIEILFRGLVTGIRDYFQRTGFKTALLGLSGGIDSSVVAALAAKALGPKNVYGVAMPSQFSSTQSLTDAEALARNLGIGLEVRPIKFLYSTASRELSERRGELAPLALENMQARLRGLVLMTLSNHYNGLVLTTGNKSEIAVGYCTLYGDMAGALAPIGDLYKTRVYELARHINASCGGVIPENCLTKAPTAELRPNQTDQDSLPPYELLDPLLQDYLEKSVSLSELEPKYSDQLSGARNQGWVRRVVRMIEASEFKRRQAAPSLKVSTKAFGIGRRIPIAKKWD